MISLINIIKNQLFKKIIIFYSIIAIFFLTCLSYLSIYIINDNKTKEIKNSNKALVEEIYHTLNTKYNTAQTILNNFHTNNSYKNSIIAFMQIGYPEFQAYSLDSYFNNNISHLSNLNNYLKNSFYLDRDIDSILLYSSEKNFVYKCNSKSKIKYYNSNTTMFKNLELNLKKYSNTDKNILTTYIGDTDSSDSNAYSVVLNIQHPILLRSVGKLIINYNNDSLIKSYRKRYNTLNPGHVIIATTDNNIIFQTTDKYKNYINNNILRKTTNTHSRPVDSTYIIKHNYDNINIKILGIIPSKIIIDYTTPTILLIIVASIICILGITILSSILSISYSNRLHKITSAIKKVRKGDLSVRIKTDNKQDELTQISNNFNKMCDDLNDYIDKVYVYQVKQKSAELKSLQAQINPHFLYNTLESIRMRAAVRGALDVSEMIYILATFFRNSLKTDTITTIENEIEHCKLYLKLFQIRYNNQLTTNFNIDESMLTYSIVNLSLQPIVENYIIHGIDLNASNNIINVNAYLNNEDILIEIEDNGSGIDNDTLDNINLALNNQITPLSIGIFNVHERLKIVYGNEYGLTINSEKGVGTKVTINIPAKKKGDM